MRSAKVDSRDVNNYNERMETFQHGFRKLLAWQIAHELTKGIYRATQQFPANEAYGITNQLRRASSSIAAQIAEGSRMPTANHRKIYYDRAYASAAEVDYFLELSHDLTFLDSEKYVHLLHKVQHVSALLHRLSISCRKRVTHEKLIS